MKKQIKIIALFSILIAALMALPSAGRAQDANAGNSTDQPTPAPKRKHVLPFHGKVVAVDTNAMTLAVGHMTLNITSKTKISKDGKPATLSEIAVGDKVRGAYKKDEDGTLNATVVREGKGPKAGKKQKADAPAPSPK